jgi:hypothetical protein
MFRISSSIRTTPHDNDVTSDQGCVNDAGVFDSVCRPDALLRVAKLGSRGELSLTKDFVDDAPHYAILSNTWGVDEDEVTFNDLENGSGTSKAGYAKLQFCGKQAEKDGLEYFWVDTC